MGIESKPQFKDAFKHIKNGADEIDSDRLAIDFNPTFYVPTTGATHEDIDHLASHLKGIDAAIVSVSGSAVSLMFTGARPTAGSLDRDMESNGVLTNLAPFIIPFAANLVKITASTTDIESWEAHVLKNGVSVASITITNGTKGSSAALSIPFAEGDEVRLRQVNGTGSIKDPRITAIFQEI